VSLAVPAPAARVSRVKSGLTVAVLVAYAASTLGLAHSSNYDQGLLLVAAVFAILALSLDLVAGATGLYSLGHAGLFAIGAYGTTILYTRYGWNIFWSLPVMIVAVGVVGVIIGALSLRVSGLYFAITTLIFTIIVNVVLSDSTITGGYQGLPSPPFPSFPHGLSPLGTALVWAVSGALLITVTVIWSVRSSALYPALLAIRDSEPFASSAGVRTAATRVLIFGLSAALAGLAGWTFSFLGFITPGQFDSTASINILVMVILGGMNTRLGPIVGAVFISLFPVVITINPLWQEILFGSIFIFVIVFVPEGFVGLLARVLHRLQSWRRPATGGREEPCAGTVRGSREQVAEIARTFTNRQAESVGPAQSLPPGPALEARGISYSYVKGVRVLDQVDLVVARATIHGLIGPNGSGKSTLVNLLSGQLSPEVGTISVNGRRIEHLQAWQRAGLGLMRTFQTAVMVKELTTRDNVAIGLFSRFRRIGARSIAWPMISSARRDSRNMARAATEALHDVGLNETWARSRVADIPHGVEQLTQLAAAGVSQPSILILDEPLAGLSSGEVEQVSTILRELKAWGVTIVVVEHQTRFIFEVCDDVTVLAAGELVKTGSAPEVRGDERVRQVYLGQ
jgi:branched-chain amino acid transport system permease protein